ncbi:MAG: hypothetical protein D8M58_02255 [Calditrichaeota bacterium]|nr:MAG: hypothetical protein DWQ03_04825 [Calditrichota bacterium]MBL1204186.1 hypothetical protein [Calditrichota bacterium]NOG44016.1 hypothetical protein [Calditrichota bacterium]
MKLIFTLLFLLFSLPAFGQNFAEFGLNGNGARAAGLGYAFTGVADDASAISWNPAGLSQLYQIEASVVGRLGTGSGTIEGFSNSVRGIESWDIDVKSKFQLNFLSFVVPFNVGEFNIVGGIALRRMYDFSGEITQTIKGDGISASFFDNIIKDNVDGGINSIAPAIGVQLNEMISVGATINILTGVEEGSGSEELDEFILSEYDYEIEYSGVAMDMGLLFKPTENLSIGANFNLPHTRSFKYTKFDGMSFDGEKVDFEAPLFFRVGAAFRATDNLLFAIDYNNRPVSEIIFAPTDEKIGGKDINSIHFGGEYLITSGNSVIPVRLGFYNNPSGAVDDAGDQIVTNVLTAGVGLILGNVILDGSFEFGGTEAVIDDDDNITFKGNEFLMSLGAVIHFGNDD